MRPFVEADAREASGLGKPENRDFDRAVLMQRLLCSCGWDVSLPRFQGDTGFVFHVFGGHQVTVSCERKIGPFDCCSVVQGDCLELMKQLPDGCVDAVITDPPYGIRRGERQGTPVEGIKQQRAITEFQIGTILRVLRNKSRNCAECQAFKLYSVETILTTSPKQ
jgi:hypothetical protein